MRSWIRRSSSWLIAVILVTGLWRPAAAQVSARDKQRAARLTREAIERYQRGAYERAGSLFLRAYELSGRAAQLRNAAKAYEEGGRLERALELWKSYRARNDLTQDERNEADAHIALVNERQRNLAMEKRTKRIEASVEQARRDADAARRAAVAAQQAAPAGPGRARLVATPSPADRSPPAGAYVLLGTGLAAVVSGVVLWFVAAQQLESLDQRLLERDDQNLIIGITPEETDREVSSINTKRIASGILSGAGVAAAVGGAWWLFGGDRDEPAVSVTPSDRGATVNVFGRF